VEASLSVLYRIISVMMIPEKWPPMRNGVHVFVMGFLVDQVTEFMVSDDIVVVWMVRST